jgi:hypothetical protein
MARSRVSDGAPQWSLDSEKNRLYDLETRKIMQVDEERFWASFTNDGVPVWSPNSKSRRLAKFTPISDRRRIIDDLFGNHDQLRQ